MRHRSLRLRQAIGHQEVETPAPWIIALMRFFTSITALSALLLTFGSAPGVNVLMMSRDLHHRCRETGQEIPSTVCMQLIHHEPIRP